LIECARLFVSLKKNQLDSFASATCYLTRRAEQSTCFAVRHLPFAIFYRYACSHRFHDHKVYINVSGPLSQDKKENIFPIVEIPFDKPANFLLRALINRGRRGLMGQGG